MYRVVKVAQMVKRIASGAALSRRQVHQADASICNRITVQQQHAAAYPWFMGRCLPAPMARPTLDRSRSVTNALAARTACMGAAPLASSAAMADASVQPVPCVLPVLHEWQLQRIQAPSCIRERQPHFAQPDVQSVYTRQQR